MIILTFFVWFALNNEVWGACGNLLNETHPLELKDKDGKVIETLTRCRYLVDDYPELCKEEYGDEGGVCCKLCWTNNLNCIDADVKNWEVDGKKVGCKKYIKGHKDRCQEAFAALLCCKSCREAFLCRDFLGEVFKITITARNRSEVFVTSCEDVVSDYLSLCRGLTGQNGGACCESCAKYDLTCIDDTLVYWEMNGERYGCAEYVGKDHSRCKNQHVADTCCASCTGKGGCVDDPTFRTTIKLKVKTKSGKEKIKCSDCSCADIKKQGKKFVKKACRKKLVKGGCCDLCGKPVG